jgi:nitroreductase
MEKPAPSSYALHPLLAQRWSPRAFSDHPVETHQVCTLLEAARWAASCFNEQPWRFFVGTEQTPQTRETLRGLLVSGNDWAKVAPVLLLSVAKTTFAYDGSVNRHAFHDVGLASGQLVLQAQSLGLFSHMMAGFDVEGARTAFSLPPGVEPVAMIAVGHPADPSVLPEPLRQRELAPRERQPLQAMAFTDSLDQSYPVCFT